MTDLEISKALALEIGWDQVLPNEDKTALKQCWVWTGSYWRVFDYRDWAVAGPIAEKYNHFPFKHWQGPPYNGWYVHGFTLERPAETPQKAIAMAVIAAKGGKV